jgi:desulfoferrodoxin (superoxide reductase-like protein)
MDFNEEHIKGLELMYLDLIQPKKLIEHFNTDDEFVEWLQLGNAKDLRLTLEAFERDELYSHCKLIKEEIDKNAK